MISQLHAVSVEATFAHFFALDQSFLDLRTYSDGTAYGPRRYREIVQECWFISDNLNTSYADLLDISYQERRYLIEFINEKMNMTKKAIEEAQTSAKSNNK